MRREPRETPAWKTEKEAKKTEWLAKPNDAGRQKRLTIDKENLTIYHLGGNK